MRTTCTNRQVRDTILSLNQQEEASGSLAITIPGL
jgi:hypothetical protein